MGNAKPLTKGERDDLEVTVNHVMWSKMCQRMLADKDESLGQADGEHLCRLIIRFADKLERYRTTVCVAEQRITELEALLCRRPQGIS